MITFLKKTLVMVFITGIVLFSFPISVSAQQAVGRFPTKFTVADLDASGGCEQVTFDPNLDEFSHPEGPYVIPIDAPNIRVEYSDGTQTQQKQPYWCKPEIFEYVKTQAPRSLGWLYQAFFSFGNLMINGLNWVVGLAMYLVSELFVPLLTEGVFIRSPIVQEGWPFVQGIANLGFIFALLYIALATTLRMESISTSIQRLLPKLLIGALLVNFSLVIGGLIIDFSRVVMAAEVRLIGGASVNSENFFDRVMQATRSVSLITASTKAPVHIGSDWDYVIGFLMMRLRNVIFAGVLTIALLVISINLLVRYVALLILLIFSPFPYVALALPQTAGIFKQWWSLFLKWVFYGPIVLFFLVLLIKIQRIGFANTPQTAGGAFVRELIHFSVVAALLFIGHSISKKAAGIGSDTIMGWAKKNPRTALVAAGAMTGGLLPALGLIAGAGAARYGGRFAGRAVANAGRDVYSFGKDSIKDIAKKRGGLAKAIIAPPKRDDKGYLKDGESSFISDKLDKYIGPQGKKKDEANAAKTATAGPITAANVDHPAISAIKLKKDHVIGSISNDKIINIAEVSQNFGQVQSVVRSKAAVRKLSDDELNTLQDAIRTNPALSNNETTRAIQDLQRTIEEKDK